MTDDDNTKVTMPLVAKDETNCAKILPKMGACAFKVNCNTETETTAKTNHLQQQQLPPPPPNNNIQPQQTETNGNNNLKNGVLKPLHYG